MSDPGGLEFGLAFAAGAAGVGVALRRREHWPVALALVANPSADLLHQWLAVHVVRPAQDAMRSAGLDPFVEPLRGSAFVAGMICQGLFLAQAFILAALAVRVFLGRRPWPVLLAWFGFIAAFALGYSHLRGNAARALFVPTELGCLALSLGCAIQWTWKRRSPSLHLHGAILLMLLMECVVALTFSGVLTQVWPLARQVYVVLLFALVVLQGGWLCCSFGSQQSR